MPDHILARGHGGAATRTPKPSNAKQAFSSGPHIAGLDEEQPAAPADVALPADEVRAVESRAECECLGDLQARRRVLLTTLAPLKALHGHNGLFDDKRKSMLEAMKVKARMALGESGAKITEGMVDAHAYADPQYERFIDTGITDRVEYIVQQNELTELEERIRSRELELLVFNSEIKLQR